MHLPRLLSLQLIGKFILADWEGGKREAASIGVHGGSLDGDGNHANYMIYTLHITAVAAIALRVACSRMIN